MEIIKDFLSNFGLVSTIIGIVLFWYAFKFVKKILLSVLAFAFTIIGVLRFWSMLQ
ncbi:hypothetical protein [Viridibacillus arvi]|uniref:hypothetical protein n=1 Tax=Viridibacillus arvi TaxID=263475 RepID=UPI0034CE37D1